MQKEIQLTDKTLLVVPVPKEASNLVVDGNGSSTVRLSFYDSGWDWIKLNKGNWQLLGIYPELTEEMAKMVVDDISLGMYVDYLDNVNFGKRRRFDTALESFQSLMEREKCYTVNPLKFDPTGITTGEWQEAQKTTFDKYAILIKSK